MFMFCYYLIFIFIAIVPVVEVLLEVDGDDVSAIDGNVQVPDSPADLFLVNEQYKERFYQFRCKLVYIFLNVFLFRDFCPM